MVSAVMVLVAITAWGCKGSDDDEAPAVRSQVAFVGKLDPSYVGDWKAADGSALSLRADGSLEIVAILISPSGPTQSKLKGEWTVSGKDMLLRYSASDKEAVVLKNAADLRGDTLTLTQAGNNHKTVYQRNAVKQ